MFTRFRFQAFILTVGIVIASCAPARAPQYPTKPITLVVGISPGGYTDLGARMYGDAVGKILGQRVVILNKPGAGGIIAAQSVATSAPDGYTLLATLGGVHTILPAMQKVPFDPVNDFKFITEMFYNDVYVVVPAGSKVKTVADLIAEGKAKPGGLNFGNISIGAPTQLAGGLFKTEYGLPLDFITYRGSSEMMVDLAAQRLDFTIASYPVIKPYLANSQIRILASLSDSRNPFSPNAPTIREAGFPKVYNQNWVGLAAPAKLPPEIVKKLHDAFVQASQDPALISRLAAIDVGVRTTTPEETKAMIVSDKARLGAVVNTLGLKAQ